jgi:hypothetical protein
MAKPMKPITEPAIASASFELQRLEVVMEPEPGNPLEVEGVLNPASARGRDGQLYLFPRLVARGNYSRIGIARVRFNEAGDPVGVERLGIALEPEADYELRPDGGGCEDPRITFIEPLQRYVMTYTALSSRGPRIALAVSEDLFHWERLGLATFQPYEGVDFNDIANKDALFFPVAIPDPDGQPAMALIHRPLFPGTGQVQGHLAMTVYGFDSTLPVTLDMMFAHGAAVVRSTEHALVVVDLPFGSYQASPEQAFRAAARVLAETGCAAVKLEGGEEMAETVGFLTRRGVPVMGHVGLTPQSVNALGGYRSRGHAAAEHDKIMRDGEYKAEIWQTLTTKSLQELGDEWKESLRK